MSRARRARLAIAAILAVAAGCTRNPPAGSGPAASALAASTSTSTSTRKAEGTMNQHLNPYAWIRGGASVHLARIRSVRVAPSEPGQQTTTLELHIEETLWGPRGDEVRRAAVVEPASATAQLKFPAPLWGGITLREGTMLLLATAELGDEVRAPLHVEEVKSLDDPALVALRQVLGAETGNHDEAARRSRYLGWLASSSPVHALFGADALAHDERLPDIDPGGDVAAAFVRTFDREKDTFVRLSLGAWMIAEIYPRTSEAGKIAILNACLRGAADPSEDVRRQCLDALSEIGPTDLQLSGLVGVPAAIPFLEERLAEETTSAPRARLRKILDVLRH